MFTLLWITNQHGEIIPRKWLEVEDGVIYLREINCMSSADFGLGTCRCVSHPPVKEKAITPKEAFSITV